MQNRLAHTVFDDEPDIPSGSARIRPPFRFWIDDTWNRTVRYAKQNPWLYGTSVWVPVFLFVVLFKLLKFETLSAANIQAVPDHALVTVIAEHALLPVMIVAAAFLFGLLIQIRFAYRGSFFMPASAAAFVLLSLAVRQALASPPAWISTEFLLAIQADIFVTAIAVAITAVVVGTARGLALRSLLVVLQGLSVLIVWISCFEAAYFLQTGSMADSYMLRYSLTHLSDLRHVVGNQIDASGAFLLVLPILVAMLPTILANVRSKRARVHTRSYAWRMKQGVAVTVIVGATFFFTADTDVSGAVVLLRPSAPVQLLGDAFRFETDTTPVELEEGIGSWPSASISLARTDSTRTPNIVIMILESTRRSYPEGISTAVVSPFVDSLRNHAVEVADLSVVVPHTNKALVSILCGVFPELKQSSARSITNSCLPHLLKQMGYATAFFTPASLDFEDKGTMLNDMGYETVVGKDGLDESGFSPVNYFGYEDNIMLEPSIAWIGERVKAGKPYMATMLTLTAHHDYSLPASWTSRQFSDNRVYNRYLNAIAYQDAYVRQVMRRFSDYGWADNTVFVILSDHGEAFSEHGLQFHSAVTYQEVASVPMILYAPTYVSPRTIRGPRQQIDILPTMADLLNVVIPRDELPGRSLFEPPDSTRALYMAGWVENQSMAYRRGNMKYVYHFRRRPIEMFDLFSDPGETKDLAASISPDSLQMIERYVLTWRQSVNRRYSQR